MMKFGPEKAGLVIDTEDTKLNSLYDIYKDPNPDLDRDYQQIGKDHLPAGTASKPEERKEAGQEKMTAEESEFQKKLQKMMDN